MKQHGASLARHVTVHPTAIVENGAELGEGCVIHAHAVIKSGTTLGLGVSVHSFAVVGDDPQDQHFDSGVRTFVRVGARTVLREHVTVHRSTRRDMCTDIGDDCLLMVGCHVGHDCTVADGVVVANCSLLGGHVQIGPHAFLGGGSVVHQYCRIGEGAMIGGGARISRDVPAFTLVTERDALIGLNTVGIRRRGFSRNAVQELKEAFRAVYSSGNIRDHARDALDSGRFQEPSTHRFLTYFAEGTRGFVRPRRMRSSEDGSS